MTRRINEEDLCFGDCGMEDEEGNLFTGIVFGEDDEIDPRIGSKLAFEYEMKNGLKDGYYKVFFPEGKISAIGQYQENFAHAHWQSWHENGQLHCDSLREYGVLLKKKTWDENGALIEDYELTPDPDSLEYQRLIFRREKHGTPQTNVFPLQTFKIYTEEYEKELEEKRQKSYEEMKNQQLEAKRNRPSLLKQIFSNIFKK